MIKILLLFFDRYLTIQGTGYILVADKGRRGVCCGTADAFFRSGIEREDG